MEHTPKNPNNLDSPDSTTPSSELEHNAETPERPSMEQYAQTLGYLETPELQELRAQWTTAAWRVIEAEPEGNDQYDEAAHMAARRAARTLADQYHQTSESAVDAPQVAIKQGRQLFDTWIATRNHDDAAPIDQIAEQAAALGFTETDEQRLLRTRIAIATVGEASVPSSEETLATDHKRYKALANRREAEYYGRRRFGRNLTMGTVERELNPAGYKWDLLTARDLAEAYGTGYEDIIEAIDQELDALDQP